MFCTFRFVLIPEIMKQKGTSILIFALLVLFLTSNSIITSAQDKKFNFVISGQFAHFMGKGHQIKDKTVERYIYPIDPGIESLIGIKLGGRISILSGVSYYSGRFTTEDIDENGVPYRLKFKEFCLPFLLRGNLKKEFFVTAGVYPGWETKGHFETQTSEGKWTIAPRISEPYSTEKFILDLYLDFGKYQSLFKNQVILISPFIKYKLNDYWMGQFRSKVHCGIKIGYTIGL
jgi:hypothetical protein